jgi:hypothetical protein
VDGILCNDLIPQGKASHVLWNREADVYYDCRPTARRPRSWYAAESLAAGFVNTKKYKHQCNATFEFVGKDVFVVCKDFIPARREIFVYYPLLRKYMQNK